MDVSSKKYSDTDFRNYWSMIIPVYVELLRKSRVGSVKKKIAAVALDELKEYDRQMEMSRDIDKAYSLCLELKGMCFVIQRDYRKAYVYLKEAEQHATKLTEYNPFNLYQLNQHLFLCEKLLRMYDKIEERVKVLMRVNRNCNGNRMADSETAWFIREV